MEAIFVVAKQSGGTITNYPLPNQTRLNKKDGTRIPVDISLPVTFREVLTNVQSGTVFATNDLTLRKDGYFVAGATLHAVSDADGDPINIATGAEAFPYVEAYREFKAGRFVPSGGVFTVASNDAEKQANRVPFISLLKRNKELAPPTIDDDGFYVDTETWYFLLRSLSRKKSILLLGESGCGKTELIPLLASKVNKRCDIFDMAITNPVSYLCGNQRIIDGRSVFQYARFAQSINPFTDEEGEEQGSLILLDEISRAHPMVNNIMLPLLDRRRTLYIENAMEETAIKAGEKTVFWATANIGMEFVGTTTLDHALMTRFQPVMLQPIPADKLILLLMMRTGVAKSDAIGLVDFVNNVRNNTDLSKKISTRQLLEIAELVFDGYSKADAAKYIVLNQYEGNEVDGGEKQSILAIIQSL